jgi:hypothetical protein
MYTSEGCSTVSDQNGSLLFYTDGISVWTKQHVLMANGTGLMGHPSAAQSGLVVKQPNNANIYYLFTVDVAGGISGLRYSIIDMSLAAGMGSVTVKNILVYTPTTEKLTAVRSSNNLDVWIVTHEWGSNNFRSYKLTAAGLNTVAVISSAGTSHSGNNVQFAVGCMKISPNGTKLALAISNHPMNVLELFDFNSSTGIVSNSVLLQSAQAFVYGVEFSPNSTILYNTEIISFSSKVKQWNLSNTNSVNIVSSGTVIGSRANGQFFGIQLANNGKIYVATQSSFSLSVINSPDLLGSSCAFSLDAQSLGNKNSEMGLPTFIAMPYFRNIFSCNMEDPNCSSKVNFNLPYSPNQTFTNTAAIGYSITNVNWNFGENTSTSNLSSLYNPTHVYNSTGTLIHFFKT